MLHAAVCQCAALLQDGPRACVCPPDVDQMRARDPAVQQLLLLRDTSKGAKARARARVVRDVRCAVRVVPACSTAAVGAVCVCSVERVRSRARVA